MTKVHNQNFTILPTENKTKIKQQLKQQIRKKEKKNMACVSNSTDRKTANKKNRTVCTERKHSISSTCVSTFKAQKTYNNVYYFLSTGTAAHLLSTAAHEAKKASSKQTRSKKTSKQHTSYLQLCRWRPTALSQAAIGIYALSMVSFFLLLSSFSNLRMTALRRVELFFSNGFSNWVGVYLFFLTGA